MTRLIDLEQLHFSAWVRPGDTVAWGQCSAEPVSLTSRLMAQRHTISGRFAVFIGATWADTLEPRHADVVDFRSYCGAANNRRLAEVGMLDILPAHYSSFEQIFANGPSRVDVLLLQVAPADSDGSYSLSVSHEYLVPLLDTARVVIAEVNDQAPWTYGSRTIRAEDFDVMVNTSRALPDAPASRVGEAERTIAARVAALVDDGATLQCGIGALPETVLSALANHRALGIHSGAICDAVACLMQQGAVTNTRKGIDTGITVAGTMMGSDTIHRFAHENPQVQFRPTSYTHDIRVLESLNQFVAINGAIEVDLTGQINAETAGGRYLGAVGGAMDFMRGACRSRGGLPIIVLPSRAGARSRIVSHIDGPVSTPRSDTAVIVTEHGVADLRALPLSRRVDSLIAIAHPDDRDELERAVSVSGRTTRQKEIS
ncbi:acetyl-CoA hydrolase/transferase family protein [Paraburkholderia hospita]|uniref:acetyl-CoA hydrolase/transferase family protein n=1 Tax=Paraburkholderia hospita TaxID=169430 RepID=UPI000DEFBEB3|nr:acetyl-CoA hydrolase/transferase C-terminal domain-containing protein [Paraburkholderia hospita]AXF05581.1 acetyl-CoA hydrolase [Paraburkholderia hospita]